MQFKTMVDVLRWRAMEHPERAAYIMLEDGDAESGRLSYGQLDAEARRIAGLLLQNSAFTGARVLLLFPQGLEFVASFWGCLYGGFVAVPAYPPEPARMARTLPRLWSIIRDSQARVVLTSGAILRMARELFEMAPELASMRWLAVDEFRGSAEGGWLESWPQPEQLALLQYTSGSTGDPRGVAVSHENLLQNERLIHEVCEHTEESHMVGWSPLYHDMGLIANMLQPPYSGATSVLMPPWAFLRQPVLWLRAISRYGAVGSGGPNFAYELCVRKISEAQKEGLDLSSWKIAFVSAEPVRAETLERFLSAFHAYGLSKEALFPCFGLAEATLLVSAGAKSEAPVLRKVSRSELLLGRHREAEAEADALTLVGSGRELPGTRVLIVEPETRRECAAGRVGEIWVGGPHVARGYWNRPEETRERFKARLADTGEGPFLRTGDLGFLHEGELFVTGRIKDLILLRGKNHYPQDLELTAERAHGMVRPGCCAAFAVETPEGEGFAVALEAREERPASELAELAENVRSALASEHGITPSAVVLLRRGSLPKTSSGKLRRRACRTAYQAGSLEGMLLLWRGLTPGPVSRSGPGGGDLIEWLRSQLAALHPAFRDIPEEESLLKAGLDSLGYAELMERLEASLGVEFGRSLSSSPTTLRQIAEAVSGARAQAQPTEAP